MKQHILTLSHGEPWTGRNLPESAPVPPAPPSGTLQWISIVGEKEALEAVQKARELPGLLLHRVHTAQSFPLVLGRGDYILLRIPLRRHWMQNHADYLTLFLLPDEVISIVGEKGGCLDVERVRMLEGNSTGTVTDAGGLFLHLLDRVIDSNLFLFLGLREETEILSERLHLSDITSVLHREQNLNLLRRQANRLINQFQDTLFALSSLTTLLPHPLFASSETGLLRMIGEVQNHLNSSMSHLVARHEALQQRCYFLLQQQMDRRVSRLTVLSTIFMPLTLIAGIFGMNFKYLTGLDWQYGYPATLIGMAVLGFCLWGIMKKKGWW